MINNIAQDLPSEVVSDLNDFNENKSPTEKQNFKKYLVFILGAVFFLIFGFISFQLVNSPLIIAFTGVGDESVTATSAIISFSIYASNADVLLAAKTTRDKANEFKQLLINNKIEAKDISISEISINPSLTSAQALVYQSAVTISFKTTNVTALDDLVTLLYTNGALQVSQPILSSENQTTLEQKALAKAITEAKGKADIFATRNFKFVKKIIAIDQQTAGTTASATTSVDTAKGVFKIVKGVSVTYKMW
jgi:uncharacterized protein YggE